MTSRILRWEQGKDSNGNDEIFVNIEITDGNDIYTRAEWLIPSDVALALANINNRNTIAAQIAARGVIAQSTALVSLNYPSFSSDDFISAYNQALSPIERLNFSQVFPSFLDSVRSEDFRGIKTVIIYLLTSNQITQQTIDVIEPLFVEQGIDLNNLN